MKQYIKNKETISGKLQDEQVMLDIEKGKYFSLNPVATRIWEMLEEPLELSELCSKLVQEYNVESAQCEQETKEYLAEMVKMGLILEQS